MTFGLTIDELNLLKKVVVAPLQDRGAKVWCFGSRAKGTHHKFSDIDIMVESTQDLTQLIGEIRESIIESTFPYKVDIVDLHDFASAYRHNFESEKILFT